MPVIRNLVFVKTEWECELHKFYKTGNLNFNVICNDTAVSTVDVFFPPKKFQSCNFLQRSVSTEWYCYCFL